jgi:CBS domain-containing protein
MTAPVNTLDAEEKVAEAFARLEAAVEHFHAYPVMDDDARLFGICTFNDLKRALSANKSDRRLREIARKQIECVGPSHTLDTALVRMGRKGISQLPVVADEDASKLIGIVTMQDIARRLAKESEAATK